MSACRRDEKTGGEIVPVWTPISSIEEGGSFSPTEAEAKTLKGYRMYLMVVLISQ
ncbi:hypothetical protein [Vibrio sp. RE88]|uniref:hypothetical protein n=1 Tax=Vibrio sp. RE88 TaxID=2607610 RepID=UPI001493482A|nr:hypothetical protein [Vibrio sp. RE88]